MSSVLTVSVRSVVAVLGVVAVILAYSVGSTGGGGNDLMAAEEPTPDASSTRQIVMRGTGKATGVPDQLAFKLSVNIEAADVSVALDRANARMRRVLTSLSKEGVARKDVQTTGLNIRPVYDYDNYGPAVITGYAVSEDAGVLVRSLEDAGATIAAAVTSGGNAVRLHGLSLKISDEDTLMRRARDNAVVEAQTKASQYAEATGEELGAVISIKEVTARRSTPVFAARDSLEAASFSKVPVKAGSADLSVVVSVEWELA